MARLTFTEAQKNVAEIANRESYNIDVLYELLAAYGRSRSAITKLREGSLNLATDSSKEVLQRGVVYFKHISDSNKLHSTIEEPTQDPLVVRYNPRYLIVTDYDRLVAVDTKKNTRLDINLRDIDRDVDFFYGWTGDEITDEKTEAVADRRAADKMKDLYAEIERINRDKLADPHSNFRHDLNVFFSRLLFCFFAEDTRVFSRTENNIFTDAIKDFTQTDGSDLDQFLQTLFDALDTDDKSTYTSPFNKFPYVNGTIFDTKKHSIGIPKFNAQARKLILDCGNQNWAEINPDIFGSMFQSIVDEEQRSSHGQHYTSVPNIMKTIEPLFLDELREEFDKYYDNNQRLERIWDRISKIKIFDPACGSGNFLIIAYKELRKIEHAIIERLYGDEHKRQQLAGKLESRIKLDNFYGIEIDDFPHEIAILSLYLAKHQMNIDFEQQFGREIKLIPLKDNANIIHGDSTILDWKDVCPNAPHKSGVKTGPEQSALIDFDDEPLELELDEETWDEIYLIGNPPYLGSSMQDAVQKASMARVFKNFSNYKNLDFIAAWFKVGADYIKGTKAQLAFVSTNSICQGEQVALLWSYILEKNVEIKFAYTSFKWTNNAKNNAGVTCIVVGLTAVTDKKISKKLFSEGIAYEVENINPYLANGKNIIIPRRSKPISNLPEMIYGNKPSDGGFLILSKEEKEKLISQYPVAEKFIKRYMGADELLKDIHRYCIWVEDNELAEARGIPGIEERLNEVTEFRNNSKAKSTSDYSVYPNRFKQRTYRPENSLIVPSVTSERRKYQTLDFVGSDVVTSNRAFSIFGADAYVLGVLSSTMHNIWVNAVAGRLESRINYSSTICYNNFPLPYLHDHQKNEIAQCAREVIFARQNHSEKTIAEMYDPDKMPEDLRQAHHELDLAVDKLYRSKPYNTDEERLADLFALYEQMTEKGEIKMNEETLNIIDVKYDKTGASTKTDEMGMREMQRRAFEKRNSNHLLIKAPPASGKSRALMYIGLDKLLNQGKKKVIVAVPEKSIGSSFSNVPLSEGGFFSDWDVEDRNNLCLGTGDDKSKVKAFIRFMNGEYKILVCTHATLRFAFESEDLDVESFNDSVLAIDEFHHVSVSENSRLGDLLHNVMRNSNVQIIAMTGSYFRGDAVPILTPEDEAEFDKVTYTYYEQLNGYTYLETLGIGYHFYQGSYLDDGALDAVLDTSKKTIIHIPNVNSKEATQVGKHEEVQKVYDIIGEWESQDSETGLELVIDKDGVTRKVANLVDDDPTHRAKITKYLSGVAREDIDGVDIIVALGMAKEGFDWPWCEQALTIGYRASLTEIVQIIGRCTRDSYNKTHAQFTNLIVMPNGTSDDIQISVNNMLKAITASLLMEQVLAPNFTFTPRTSPDQKAKAGEVFFLKGLKKPPTERVKHILATELEDLTAAVLQDTQVQRAAANGHTGEYMKHLQSKIIREKLPGLSDEEVEVTRQYLASNLAFKTAKVTEDGNKKFITMANSFVNLDELSIDLIDSINPFQHAFEVISKKVGTDVFRVIQDTIAGSRIDMSDEDALALVPHIKAFVVAHNGKYPALNASDKNEKLLAQAQAYLTARYAKWQQNKATETNQ